MAPLPESGAIGMTNQRTNPQPWPPAHLQLPDTIEDIERGRPDTGKGRPEAQRQGLFEKLPARCSADGRQAEE
jgi:hypothetical protein